VKSDLARNREKIENLEGRSPLQRAWSSARIALSAAQVLSAAAAWYFLLTTGTSDETIIAAGTAVALILAGKFLFGQEEEDADVGGTDVPRLRMLLRRRVRPRHHRE
jgi:hypothetical protein